MIDRITRRAQRTGNLPRMGRKVPVRARPIGAFGLHRSLAGLFFLAGCSGLPPSHVEPHPDGMTKLERAAEAQGAAQLKLLHDINVSYSGTWSNLINKIQPVLIDEDYRGGSDERLLLEPMAIGQRHTGRSGTKQVYRSADAVQVWRNDDVDTDADSLAAAALVADDYRLFLLGSMLLAKTAASAEDLGFGMVAGSECDRILVTLKPGLGFSSEDRVEVAVDHATHLLRRMRFSLEGLGSTRGAVAQIDLSDYVVVHGIAWPTHFVESLVKPIPGLRIHDWHLTGLDLDRGYTLSDISGPGFEGSALPRAGSR